MTPDEIDYLQKGLVEWRDMAQTNARHAEQQAADTAARDWLISIGSEPK